MLLNLDIIQSNLSSKYTTKRYGSRIQNLCLSAPRLYEYDTVMEEGCLYILRSESLPKVVPTMDVSFICIGERIPTSWIAKDIQILQISGAKRLAGVFNAVQEIFDRYAAFDRELHDELGKEIDFDLRNLLRIGSCLLKNPCSLANQDLSKSLISEIISRNSETFEVRVQDVQNPLQLTHSKQIKDACQLERSITTPYLSTMSVDNHQSYCQNIYTLGGYKGCIFITPLYKPFQPGDFLLANYFFSLLQKGYIRHLRQSERPECSGTLALNNLLANVPLSDEEKNHLRLEEDESFACFKLKTRQGTQCMPKDYMCSTINLQLPQTAYTVIYRNEVVGLIRLKDTNDTNLSAIACFAEVVASMGYIAGLSNKYRDLDLFQHYFLQANYMAENWDQLSGGQTICYFKDHALGYMLSSCVNEIPLNTLLCKGIRNLLEYDKKRNTEHLRTLHVYLENEMNISRTAEQLFVHRSSILKRLDKIYRLIDEDLEKPDTKLYYRICLALLQKEDYFH